MAASPTSWWSAFITAMQNAPSMKTQINQVRVLGGKSKLPFNGAPPRVVLFPVSGRNGAADDRTIGISSGWVLLTAHLWAVDDGDGAWDLRERFFQALSYQATGDVNNPNGAGIFWRLPEGDNERWDTTPDTTVQGQAIEIDVAVRVDALQPALGLGQVDATSMLKAAKLTADLSGGATTAMVDATSGYPTSGVLHIDAEAIGYTGVTPTSFTGLTRGIKGTTAAAHTSGAEVDLSPT